MKRFISALLCFVLLLSSVCVASAGFDKSEYNGYPVIVVAGYSSSAQYRIDENGNKLTGMEMENFGSALNFLQSRTGFMICIIIPLALFFIWQIYKLISMFMTAKAESLDEESKKRVIEEYLAQQNQENSQNEEEK